MSRDYKNNKPFKWILFLFWFLISLIFLTVIGICIFHETGHYLIGKILNCPNLKISCPLFANIQDVSGWESCFSDNLGNKGLSVCNIQTALINLGGFIFSLVIILLIFFIINFLLKKINRYYLDRKFLWFEIIFIILWVFRSSSLDFKNLILCYNVQFGIFIYNLFSFLPYLYAIILLVWLLYDLIIFIKNKKLNKVEVKNG